MAEVDVREGATKRPEIVDKIKALEDDMQLELGNRLMNIEGEGNRPVGTISE